MLKLDLHPYQHEPVRRFLERGNLLVSYEMGTGKTPIAIACAEQTPGMCLVVCPAGLRTHWLVQIGKFSDQNVLLIPGSPPKKRKEMYDWLATRESKYVILSYETLVADARWVRRLKPAMVVLDEASAIKTFKSQRTKKVKQILVAPKRLALTGTPMENRPDEVYSIMQWVDPAVLGRWDLFDHTFIDRDQWGGVRRYKNLPVLHSRLSAAQSRAKRSDPAVRPYLPDEDYNVWRVALSPEMRHAYKRMAADMAEELDNLAPKGKFNLADYYYGLDDGALKMGRLGAIHVAMEMLLDHPDLVVLSAQDYSINRGGSKYCWEKWQEDLVDDVLASPKLDFLVEKIEDILGYEGNKVIIFTKFKRMVPILAAAIGYPCQVYHGDMTASQKDDALEQFKIPGMDVLISTHAGAYGTDMYMANYLIKYDLPYSHGKDSQISGRHARAASEFSKVFTRDLICTGTVEERNHERIIFKRKSADAVVDNLQDNDAGEVINDVTSLRLHLDSILGKR